MRLCPALLILFALLTAHCRTTSSELIHDKALSMAASADKLAKAGKMAEAEALIYDLQYLHPDDPAVRRIQSKLTIDYRTNMEGKKILGKNIIREKPRHPTTAEKIIFYIPNLVGDFLDIFTSEISFGPQIGLDLHLTRAVNATAFAGAKVGAGFYQKQLIGWRQESSLEVVAGPVGPSLIRGTSDGFLPTSNASTGAENFILHSPKGNLYQTYRDYWSSGSQIGLVLIGASAEFHFLEFADFLTGIVGYDLLDDNIRSTENFDLTREEQITKKDIESYISSGGIADYQRDYPQLGYLTTEEKAEKAAGLIRITATRNTDQPAHIVILNFNNRTGSGNYGWLSGSLSSAIFDSMKKGFVFRGEDPNGNQVLAGTSPTMNQSETSGYAQLCEKIDADYLVLGMYSRSGTNQIEVVAHVYGRQQKRVLSEFRKKADASSAIFSVSDEISKEVVQLMKKLPQT